jgi:hypothetical protein
VGIKNDGLVSLSSQNRPEELWFVDMVQIRVERRRHLCDLPAPSHALERTLDVRDRMNPNAISMLVRGLGRIRRNQMDFIT